jgi:hypothetical protein
MSLPRGTYVAAAEFSAGAECTALSSGASDVHYRLVARDPFSAYSTASSSVIERP